MVFGPDGTVLDTILVPGQTTNCTGVTPIERRSILHPVTASTGSESRSPGVEEHSSVPGDRYILYQNYPNPFNPGTKDRV